MSANKNRRARSFMVNALLGISNDDAEMLATVEKNIYAIGNFIRQKDKELFEEMIRFFTFSLDTPKRRIEIKKALTNISNM